MAAPLRHNRMKTLLDILVILLATLAIALPYFPAPRAAPAPMEDLATLRLYRL